MKLVEVSIGKLLFNSFEYCFRRMELNNPLTTFQIAPNANNCKNVCRVTLSHLILNIGAECNFLWRSIQNSCKCSTCANVAQNQFHGPNDQRQHTRNTVTMEKSTQLQPIMLCDYCVISTFRPGVTESPPLGGQHVRHMRQSVLVDASMKNFRSQSQKIRIQSNRWHKRNCS